MKNIHLRALLTSKSRAVAAVVFMASFIAVTTTITAPVHAAVGINKMMSFQGKVVNTNGTNVSDTTYSFRFRIYSSTAPTDATNTCSANSCLWEETKNIATVNGIFQTNLGDTVAL